jgi:phage FluMu protein Com
VHTTLKQVRLDGTLAGDMRCECGKLLARVLHSVLELKCPRCKRVTLVVNGQRYESAGAPPCACRPSPALPAREPEA